MTYWFLTSGNSQRDYSIFFEASTKCYPPLVESPLWTLTPDPDSKLAKDGRFEDAWMEYALAWSNPVKYIVVI